MTIELMKEEDYNELVQIHQNFPALTFHNKGYEDIDRSKFTEKEMGADKRVGELLNKHIHGFIRFQNFTAYKSGEPVIRFQYYWDTGFRGVGYLTINTLKNGFTQCD